LNGNAAAFTDGKREVSMFNRLLESIGNEAAAKHPPHHEVQLATAILIVAIAPADFQSLAEEHATAVNHLRQLFNLNTHAAQRLFGRAVAARVDDPAMFPAATILKRATDKVFRQKVLQACHAIAEADGNIHEFEHELLQRLAFLLNVTDLPQQRTA
jgi:uncharacterized tellurite resistance protein B-like protein